MDTNVKEYMGIAFGLVNMSSGKSVELFVWQTLEEALQSVYICTAFKLLILLFNAFLQNQNDDLGIIFVLRECYSAKK